MSRSKKLYALCGVLLAVCLITMGVSTYEERREEIKNSDEIILEVDSDAVTSLSWEYESESLSFHKEENWLYDEDGAFPVDGEKIAELLEQFQEFGVSFVIENVEDFGQYGLETPLCTIRIGTEEESYEILLGDYSAMDSERYVSIGDGCVYLVKHDPLEEFDAVLSDLIKHDEIPNITDAAEIVFSGEEDLTVVYEEDSDATYCAEDVFFAEQDGERLPLDTSNVDGWLQTVRGLDLTEYVSYNVSEEELAAYGLDDPEMTVTVQYRPQDDGAGNDGSSADGDGGSEDGEALETFVLHISRDPEERQAAESGSEEDAEEEITAYVRVGGSQIVYQITADEYTELMDASYNTLRHQEILSADFADVTQLDIVLEGETYTLTAGEEDGKTVWYYQEEEAEISDLRNTLKALEAESFTEEQPSRKEEISLTVRLDNENYPEISIALYRYDGSSCLAAVDGEPVALVERSGVIDLIEAVHAIVLN